MNNDVPNFAAWSNALLAQFATEAYAKLRLQEEALEQLRLDLKDAMNLLRNKNDDTRSQDETKGQAHS